MPRNKGGPVCLPLEQWPDDDQAAWREAIDAADPFGRPSAASAWSNRSRAKTAKGYGRWLYWTLEAGVDQNLRPADRVTAPAVQRYIADLRRMNGDFTILCRIQELYDAIRVIAPDHDWAWLRRVQTVLRARSVPVRDKASRIQPAEALVELGKSLMAKAEAARTKPPLSRAVLFRDGLMIAFLASRPLRLSNLAMIKLGQHMLRQGSGYRLFFSGDEMKEGEPFDTTIPTALIVAFDRYLDHYRPILLSRGGRQDPAESDSLWISEIATPLDTLSIPQRIKKHTRAAFGKHLWPHLFRDCAATTIATEGPQHVGIIKSVLGHATLRMSEKHYNQAASLSASRRYQQLIADLLEELYDESERVDLF